MARSHVGTLYIEISWETEDREIKLSLGLFSRVSDCGENRNPSGQAGKAPVWPGQTHTVFPSQQAPAWIQTTHFWELKIKTKIAVEWSQVPYRAFDVYPSGSSMVNGFCNVGFPGKVGLEHRHWCLSHYRARNRCRIPGKGR